MKALKDCSWHELLGMLAEDIGGQDIVKEMASRATVYTNSRPKWQKGKYAPQLGEQKNLDKSNAARSERLNMLRRLK